MPTMKSLPPFASRFVAGLYSTNRIWIPFFFVWRWFIPYDGIIAINSVVSIRIFLNGNVIYVESSARLGEHSQP